MPFDWLVTHHPALAKAPRAINAMLTEARAAAATAASERAVALRRLREDGSVDPALSLSGKLAAAAATCARIQGSLLTAGDIDAAILVEQGQTAPLMAQLRAARAAEAQESELIRRVDEAVAVEETTENAARAARAAAAGPPPSKRLRLAPAANSGPSGERERAAEAAAEAHEVARRALYDALSAVAVAARAGALGLLVHVDSVTQLSLPRLFMLSCDDFQSDPFIREHVLQSAALRRAADAAPPEGAFGLREVKPELLSLYLRDRRLDSYDERIPLPGSQRVWRVRTPSGARAVLKRYGPDFSHNFLREVTLLSGLRSVAGVVDADGFFRDETRGDFFLQARVTLWRL